MRRRLQIAVLSMIGAALALPAAAQETITPITPQVEAEQAPSTSAFGIIGGLNFSRLALSNGNALDNAKKRTMFAGGAFLTIGIGQILAIQPEVLFTMKGTKASNPTQNFTTGDLTLSMDYIQIPLLVKGYIPLGNPQIRPVLFAGPAVAFLVNCRVGEDVVGGTRSCDNGGPTIKSNDTSIIFGGGVDFLRNFTAQVRFDMGMTDVDEEQGSAKNRSVQLMIGYLFHL